MKDTHAYMHQNRITTAQHRMTSETNSMFAGNVKCSDSFGTGLLFKL